MNIVLDRMVNRRVILSLELCQAYIVSEDDVQSILSRIIEIDHIRERFHRDSLKRRNEMIDQLSSISKK